MMIRNIFLACEFESQGYRNPIPKGISVSHPTNCDSILLTYKYRFLILFSPENKFLSSQRLTRAVGLQAVPKHYTVSLSIALLVAKRK
jgi:hypothetical protein